MEIKRSVEALFVAAERLNSVSDELNDIIKAIDAQLKKLNLGVHAVIEVTAKIDPYYTLGFGYGKIGSNWGLYISNDKEKWLFANAPRKYRLEVVDWIPEVLNELRNQTEKMIRNIELATEKVERINNANK